jgi:uncharacterized protein
MKPMKIAVVGAGIAGLSAAWLLSRRHDVTLFEREQRPGGHAKTIDMPGRPGMPAAPVDTGFIVYNTQSYPNLVALFDHLQVRTARSDMSFAFSLDQGTYEYSGTGLAGIFGQGLTVLIPRHLGMLLEIRRFFGQARQLLAAPTEQSLGDFLTTHGYSHAFIQHHILPMAAAIWCCPAETMLSFPALAFARFFANHGLLQIKNRPEWRTVVGGASVYVNRLLQDFQGQLALDRTVTAVQRDSDGVTIVDTRGRASRFGACVIAVHADAALAVLAEPNAIERDLLGAFAYQNNRAVLHTDVQQMPRRRRIWSSWKYLSEGASASSTPCVTYWMNRLQPLGTSTDTFVTLNPSRPVDPAKQIAAFDYAHPVFDYKAMTAQQHLWSLHGRRRTWFCGSYFGSGFHEDGLQSGLAVAQDIGGVRRPWSVACASGRIHVTSRRDCAPMVEAAQ